MNRDNFSMFKKHYQNNLKSLEREVEHFGVEIKPHTAFDAFAQ